MHYDVASLMQIEGKANRAATKHFHDPLIRKSFREKLSFTTSESTRLCHVMIWLVRPTIHDSKRFTLLQLETEKAENYQIWEAETIKLNKNCWEIYLKRLIYNPHSYWFIFCRLMDWLKEAKLTLNNYLYNLHYTKISREQVYPKYIAVLHYVRGKVWRL